MSLERFARSLAVGAVVSLLATAAHAQSTSGTGTLLKTTCSITSEEAAFVQDALRIGRTGR